MANVLIQSRTVLAVLRFISEHVLLTERIVTKINTLHENRGSAYLGSDCYWSDSRTVLFSALEFEWCAMKRARERGRRYVDFAIDIRAIPFLFQDLVPKIIEGHPNQAITFDPESELDPRVPAFMRDLHSFVSEYRQWKRDHRGFVTLVVAPDAVEYVDTLIDDGRALADARKHMCFMADALFHDAVNLQAASILKYTAALSAQFLSPLTADERRVALETPVQQICRETRDIVGYSTIDTTVMD